MAQKNDFVKTLNREVLLGLWKAHILHHAAEEPPVVGMWMLRELRRHGYEVSPGTMYPLLQRMESHGWLRSESDPNGGPRAARRYYLTELGREVLNVIRQQIAELHNEVNPETLSRRLD